MVTKATTSWTDVPTIHEEREVLTCAVCDEIASVFFALRVTKCSYTYGSHWLYVGTDKSNVRLVRVEGLALSAYTIYWNEVVER